MIHTEILQPGVTLRCFQDDRFKHGCLTVQFVREMKMEEASLNAIIPAVLLRGTKSAPNLRAIVRRLDDLYGAAIGPVVRRVGNYQTTGFGCSFIEDRYAMEGDEVLRPMVEFLGEVLLEPVRSNGVFSRAFIKSEKKNLISTLESQKNNKRAYANNQMLRKMCRKDSFGIPRLGTVATVKKITPENAWAHYGKVLRESRLDIFYVGQAEPATVAEVLRPLLEKMERCYVNQEVQQGYVPSRKGSYVETMDVSQGKLCLGFTTDVTIGTPLFPAMQVLNTLYGGGMTSLLFMNVREKMSLCYDISSSFTGSKGIMVVSAGIDCDKDTVVKEEVLKQLEICKKRQFTKEQLKAAKQALINSLQGLHDSPSAIENYYASGVLSGLNMTPEEYKAAVQKVTAKQVAQVARKLKLHTTYFLKGVAQCN